MEATFWEVRQRLGFETQKHWSDRAIERGAPAMLALFSVVTLIADQHMDKGDTAKTVRRTAWYAKSYPTFSDALALVRRELWVHQQSFCGLGVETETVEIPREFINRLTDAVCYAA